MVSAETCGHSTLNYTYYVRVTTYAGSKMTCCIKLIQPLLLINYLINCQR